MKKIFKNPTTTVYEIKLRDGILQNTSNIGIGDSGDKDPGSEGDYDDIGAREENIDESNNRGSVWDNLW